MTFTVGKELMYRDEFDGIRKFIRYGDGEKNDYFSTNAPPILYDDQKLEQFGVKITQGHLIVVERHEDKIVSKLSLFNSHTYSIGLCSNYRGIWFPLKSGHLFDIVSKEISELFSVRTEICD